MPHYLAIDKKRQVFHLLCEGNGISSISRIVGCSKNTISKFIRRYTEIVEFINWQHIKNLNMPEIEADEIRTYVQKKTNLRWVYIALDRESRMVVYFHVGSRNEEDARMFLNALSARLNKISQISTDCLKSYVAAINRTQNWFDNTESIDLLRARFLGKNTLRRSITNRVEKQNATVRQHVSRLARRTGCFSKKEEFLVYHLMIYFFYYNFIKINRAVKATPAIAAKITTKRFTIDDLLEYDMMWTEQIPVVISQEEKKQVRKKIKAEKWKALVSCGDNVSIIDNHLVETEPLLVPSASNIAEISEPKATNA